MQKVENIDIFNTLQQIEKRYCCEAWTVGDVHIWPVVRTALGFQIIPLVVGKTEATFKEKVLDFVSRATVRARKELFQRNPFNKPEKLNLQPTDYLFASSYEYLALDKGEYVDKFFDEFMDYLESKGKKCLLTEYQYSNKKFKRRDRVVFATYLLDWAKWLFKNKSKTCSILLPDIHRVLKAVCTEYNLDYTKIETDVINNINLFFVWKEIWNYILEKTNPQAVFSLCGYNSMTFALSYVCNKKGIPVCEFQHGGVDNGHWAYQYAELKYYELNTLPNKYLMWDEFSKNIVKNGMAEENKVFAVGNPWIRKMANTPVRSLEKVDLRDKNLILYTLQVITYPLVPQFLIDAIKENSEFVFAFRFHPRMKIDEINTVKRLLKTNKITEKVIFLNAEPLPAVLKKCFVHLSALSGSIQEANQLGVPINVSFSKDALIFHKEMIDDASLAYYDTETENDFLSFVRGTVILNKAKGLKASENSIYKMPLTEFYENILKTVELQ